jgi:hypothetical protein
MTRRRASFSGAPGLALLTGLAWAACGFGQTSPPPRIAITSPRLWLIVGETVQLQATVRDAAGNVVPSPVVNWTGGPLVRVDSSGRATAMGVTPQGGAGGCTVNAQSPGAGNVGLLLTCLPLRIDLQPSQADLSVGEQLQFTARALDFNGDAIPNLNLTWQVTGANAGQINAARIDGNGMFTALGTGLITVRARFDAPNVPGRIQQVWDAATVRIQPKSQYRVRRLISSDEVRHSFTLRATRSWSAVNENGQAAFSGSLDGIATALLSYEGGAVRMVTQGGTPILGQLSNSPDGVSLNRRGEVLTRSDPGLLLYTRNGGRYLLFQGQSIAAAANIRFDGSVQAGSLNDLGDVVFRANYTASATGRSYSGLFRVLSGRLDLVASNENPPPGLAESGFTFADYGVDGEGIIWFVARRSDLANDDPNARALYRLLPPNQPERVYGAEQLRSITNISNVTVSRDGGVAMRVDSRDSNPRLIRFRGSQRSELDAPGVGSIYSVADSAGVLFNFCSTACGVGRWKDGAVTQLLLQGRLAPNGEPITGISQAALSPAGVLTAHVTTAENDYLLMQSSTAGQTRLLQAGDRVDVDAGPQFNGLVRGGPGGPLYLTLGSPHSLFEYDSGALIPRLVVGERLPDGTTFFAGVTGAVTGEPYFSVQNSSYRFRNGAVETAFPAGMRLPDGVLTNSSIRAVNANGAMVISATVSPASGPSNVNYYLAESGRFTEITRIGARLPDGRVISSVNEFYLDDNNRVAFRPAVSGQNVASYFFWAGGGIQPLTSEGRNLLGGISVTNFSVSRVRGGKFFGFGNNQGGGDQGFFEHPGGNWQPLVLNADRMPDGSVQGYSFGAWDANSLGELVFVTQSGSPMSVTVRTAGGEFRQVLSMLAPTPEGDYLRSIQEFDFRDDGRIFFTAFEASGRFSVYVAEPLQ